MDLFSLAVPVALALVAVVVLGAGYQWLTGGWDRTTTVGVVGTTVAAGCYALSRLTTTPALDRSYELPLLVVGFASSSVVVVLAVWYAVRARQG